MVRILGLMTADTLEVVLDDWNTSAEVYADRGYPSQEREEQPKATTHCPNANSGATYEIAKVRARVEHVFGAVEQMGGKCIRTIGQARADFALTMMAVT
jgi:hypothetical protein